MNQIHIDCECGFEGGLPVIDGLSRCVGCDRIYKVVEGRIMEQVTEIPKFQSYEELEKFLSDTNKGKTKGEKVRTPTGKRVKKAVAKDSAQEIKKVSEVVQAVYQTIHFYLRPGDEFAKLLKDGREEKKYRDDSVLVFVHSHLFTEVCDFSCREI